MKALLAQQARRPEWERTHGAGLLLAEAIVSVGNGLHSRAPALLALLLKEDLLTATAAPSAGSSAGSKAAQSARKGGSGGAGSGGDGDAAVAGSAQGAPGASAIPQEVLRARATSVASAALQRLLPHLRRGKCAELWAALLAECNRRLAAALAAASGAAASSSSGGALPAARSAARMVGLIAEVVAFVRGSRVEDFKPVFEIAKQATRLLGQLQSDSVSGVPATSGATAGAAASTRDEPTTAQEEASEEPYLDASLSEAALQLVLHTTLSHLRAIGASEGMGAVVRAAPGWSPLFALAPTPELVPFAAALMAPPSRPDALRIFAPQLLGCLGHALLEEGGEAAAAALPLMIDACTMLQPQASEHLVTHGRSLWHGYNSMF